VGKMQVHTILKDSEYKNGGEKKEMLHRSRKNLNQILPR
jgi:hypothetical protein